MVQIPGTPKQFEIPAVRVETYESLVAADRAASAEQTDPAAPAEKEPANSGTKTSTQKESQ